MGDINYFIHVIFTKQSDNYFTSLNSCFRPGNDAGIGFYAYRPSKTELGVDGTNTTLTINNSTKELENFTLNGDISKQVDFITACATGRKSDNETSGVPLTFGRPLLARESQIFITDWFLNG